METCSPIFCMYIFFKIYLQWIYWTLFFYCTLFLNFLPVTPPEPKLFYFYYNMSNILVVTCAHCNLFVGSMLRLTLSLANVAPTLISLEENIQEYFKVSLRELSCCICVLSYGSMWVCELGYLSYYLNKVIVRFLFAHRQNVAKYDHVLNLVVWTTWVNHASSFVIYKSHMSYFTLQ